VRPSSPPDPIGRIVAEFGRAYPEAFFVQVGSNDGEHLDPLREQIRTRRWRGIMVEPVPYVFARLRAAYGDNPRITLEPAAIAESEGLRELHHLREAEAGAPVPEWYDQLGSFRREVVLKHRDAIPDFDERLTTTTVPCITFDHLCRKHGVDRVDLVHIDTEGYDFEVVKLVDLEARRPHLLLYEHLHLDEATRRSCTDHVRARGYEQLSDAVDTICLRTVDLTPRDGALARVWTELRAAIP
jgi:FkbM family methyltransferase